MLSYYLLDNPVTEDPTDFRAQVVTKGSKTDGDLIDFMVARGSTVTKAEAQANIQEYIDAALFFLKEGYTINSHLLRAAFSISGVFTSEEDSFDTSRHQVNINLQLGSSLRKLPEQMKTTKVEGKPAMPLPKTLLDITTNSQNDRLTPGGTVKVTGKRMKVDPEVPTQGVYLINGNKTVKVDTFVTNRPSELVMVLPKTLGQGSYTLEVRGSVNGAERQGQLPATLTV